MKRRDRNIGTRSDISRLGKPCSKIEAKLLSRRRSKKENEDKESARLTKPSIDSSSESEISPRLFTSKQHVELANFEAQNNVPLLQKYLQNSNEKYKYDSGIDLKKINSCNSKINIVERANFQSKRTNDISNVYTNDSYDKSDKTLNFSKKNHSKHLFDYFSTQHLSDTKSVIKLEKSSAHINNDSKRNTDEHLLANESNEKTFFPTNETTKRRSRSAPCTPLFKIKCSKDKFPCDLFAVGKSLTDDEIREKIRKHRKHAPISLRMSRSGEVSVSSYEKSSDERKIERISSEESTTENDLRELHIAIKKSPTSKTDEETVLVSDSEKNGIIRNEIIHDDDDDNGKATLKETNEFMKILPICTENSEIIENIAALPITEEKIQDEKITETISSPSGNFVNKEKPKIPENQHCSPKQLTKKRDFKWKTMMEKHRHQLVSRTSENFIKPVEMTDKMENSRSKFWPEATADIPKNNLRPTLRNSFEEKKIEAYNIIKEEFPKLFMKRQIVNAMTNKSIDINGEINSCRNIHKPNSLISRNVDIISKIMKSNFEDSKELGKKMYRSENHVGQRNILTNVEQSERKCRPSILKRPKSPSPRRVTFRLPGLVIHEKSLQHERNFAQTIEAQEIGLKNSLKPMDGFAEEPKDTETNDNSRQPDRLLSACIYEKVRKFHNDNLSICKETKQCSIPPRFSAIEKNALESDDFTQDWETPPTADTHRCFEEVKYPKETREAMKILSAGENLRCKHFGRVSSRGSAYRETEENYRPQNSLMAPSYAEALAKFQGSSDKAGQQSVPVMTKHNSGSRNTNVVVEIHDNELQAGIKKSSRKIHSENCCSLKLENLRNQLSEESTRFREIVKSRAISRTMQSNGSETGISENGVDRTGWTVGLINGKFKYLTAETFGFKINANGASLKKKQLWTLEGSEHQVYLRSHLDRYLAVDQFGNVTCEAEDPSDPGCAFQIQLASDGSGRWALKNVQRGYFLGSSQDELKCMAKAPGDAEYWLVHLAARPQVNLRSAGRKRFAHLSASQDEIHVDAPVPWGEDTLFTLEFRAAAMTDNEAGPGHGQGGKTEGGHYALHTCNNKYLARDGKLLDSCTRDCLYAAEFHAGLLALRDIHGAYLAPIGSKAVLKSRSTTVTRDELFSLEESLPQASFVAALNQRYVSVKQGVDVTANQDEISGHETFQLEFDRVTKRWYVRTMQDRYWSLEAGGGIQASDHKRSSNALFDLVWQTEDGTVSLRANNGKFLATKRSGHLYANADSPDSGDSDASKYYFYLMNRPILVLRCEQGFVGPKSAASPKLECNKAGYETIRVERCERGIVRFKGQNGKYWHADSEGVTVDSDLPSEGFYLELREPSRLCIKCTDGRYLTAGKNGALRLGETDHDSATKWEF